MDHAGDEVGYLIEGIAVFLAKVYCGLEDLVLLLPRHCFFRGAIVHVGISGFDFDDQDLAFILADDVDLSDVMDRIVSRKYLRASFFEILCDVLFRSLSYLMDLRHTIRSVHLL